VNTTLSHLPEHKQKQLREIAGIIVKAVDPEKVKVLPGWGFQELSRDQQLPKL